MPTDKTSARRRRRMREIGRHHFIKEVFFIRDLELFNLNNIFTELKYLFSTKYLISNVRTYYLFISIYVSKKDSFRKCYDRLHKVIFLKKYIL